MRKNKVQLLLSDVEMEKLADLSENAGCLQTEFLRMLIINEYDRKNPAYRSKAHKIIAQTLLTPEQKCEKLGGRVMQSDAGPMAVFTRPGTEISIKLPITMVERFEDAAESMGLI